MLLSIWSPRVANGPDVVVISPTRIVCAAALPACKASARKRGAAQRVASLMRSSSLGPSVDPDVVVPDDLVPAPAFRLHVGVEVGGRVRERRRHRALGEKLLDL